jgi:hypothetical protein
MLTAHEAIIVPVGMMFATCAVYWLLASVEARTNWQWQVSAVIDCRHGMLQLKAMANRMLSSVVLRLPYLTQISTWHLYVRPSTRTHFFYLSMGLRLTAVGVPPRWPRDTPLSEMLALNFADKWWLLSRYSSLLDRSPRSLFLFMGLKWNEVHY